MDEKSDLPSLNAFLNAALREGLLAEARMTDRHLEFRLPDGELACVTVSAQSRFRCRFSHPVTSGGIRIGVAELLARLTADADPVFAARVADSVATVRDIADADGEPEGWTFDEAEMALRFGHVLHPNPRSRDGLTAREAWRYAPESGRSFALSWFAVEPGCTASGGAATDGFNQLAMADGIRVPHGLQAMPVHPLQLGRFDRNRAALESSGERGIIPLGEGRANWRSTASMRAVHAFHAPYMVKFSLNIRLTNSIRLLAPREVLRGLHVTDLLKSSIGDEIATAFPKLTVLTEPAFVALKGAEGAAVAETIAVLRDNPFRDAGQAGPVILAALCEMPREGVSPLGRMILRLAGQGEPGPVARRWFADFLDKAIHPILEMRARWGLLFGSHQQNMMLRLNDGWPDGVVIRDCQGTGHLIGFHDRLAAICPGIGEGAENILDAETGDNLLTYYVVVNSVMNTLATIALDGLADEAALYDVWRAFLERAARETPGDAALYRKLVAEPRLTAKANFATSLSGVNEADGGSEAQLAQFIDLENPLARSEAA
ncbi:IucA/IucC family protein [Pseudohoeflea suaedae]|nr:IucA/IucC family protein [Pseudohoeflea suaedae]